jgi:class 3 adenylate cyclase
MKLLVVAADPEDRKLAAFLDKYASSSVKTELLSAASFPRSFKAKAAEAFVYFYLPGLGAKKAAALAAKLSDLDTAFWGVLDPAGEVEDPAALFFAGGRDFIGPKLFKSGIGPSRLKEVLAHASVEHECAEPPPGPSPMEWEKLTEGETIEARFCYAAVADQENLAERIGEKRLSTLKDEFASFIDSWSRECGGIAWIRDSGGCLLLFPPNDIQTSPLVSAFRLLLDRIVVGYEVFHLPAPISFRFAFHAGRTVWRKPGATGTVVSDDVNFVFHLGQRIDGDGRIIVSESALASIPVCIRDLFSPAGSFEGRALHASRRFID